MRKFLDWLYAHGITTAYAFLITFTLAISSVALLVIVLFSHWWSKIK